MLMLEMYNCLENSMAGMAYTFKCNIKCKHCLFKCSPKRKEKMKLSEAINYLNVLASEKIKYVAINGGEPLLFFNEINRLLAHAKKLGLKTAVISNGFWAKNEKKALNKIKTMRKNGLSALAISFDEFHQEFIPVENIANIIKASKKIKEIKVKLKIRGLKDLKILELINELSKKTGKHTINVSLESVFPAGRAHKIKGIKKVCLKKTRKVKCSVIFPFINPKGEVYLCCNAACLGKKSVYFLGSTKEKPLEKILQEFKKSRIAYLLRNESIYDLPFLNNNKNKYAGICHYCMEKIGRIKKKKLLSLIEDYYSK